MHSSRVAVGCTNRNNNIVEDEEHAINKRCIKDVLNIDDQESISKFLWDIRNIRVNSGSEC